MQPAAYEILKKFRGYTPLQKLATHYQPTRVAFPSFLFYEMTNGRVHTFQKTTDMTVVSIATS